MFSYLTVSILASQSRLESTYPIILFSKFRAVKLHCLQCQSRRVYDVPIYRPATCHALCFAPPALLCVPELRGYCCLSRPRDPCHETLQHLYRHR